MKVREENSVLAIKRLIVHYIHSEHQVRDERSIAATKKREEICQLTKIMGPFCGS